MQLLTNCDDIIPNDNYIQKSLVNNEKQKGRDICNCTDDFFNNHEC